MKIRLRIVCFVGLIGAAFCLLHLYPSNNGKLISSEPISLTPRTDNNVAKVIENRSEDASLKNKYVHSDNVNSITPNAESSAQEISAQEITVTESDIAEWSVKLLGKPWHKYNKEQQNEKISELTKWIIAHKMAQAGKLRVRSQREGLTEGPGKLDPLVEKTKLSDFVAAKSTPGAFIAAAGADRDASWLDRGLDKFPGDNALLKAKALMDFAYLKDPALIEALRAASPDSGWPDILSADVALGQKRPREAFDAIQNAIKHDITFSSPSEIAALMQAAGLKGQPDHFMDLGNDGSRITSRMAGEFFDAAKGATAGEDAGYYAAAALALYDLRSDSSYSEEAKMAARDAIEVLKFLGPERAAGYLDGQTYGEAQAGYRAVITAAEAAKTEALAYRATLSGQARTEFDQLRDQFGSAAALQQSRSQ
jgi:hypothetical protein